MLIATIPAIIMIVGLLVYGFSVHKQIGVVMFGCGLFVVLYLLASHTIRIG